MQKIKKKSLVRSSGRQRPEEITSPRKIFSQSYNCLEGEIFLCRIMRKSSSVETMRSDDAKSKAVWLNAQRLSVLDLTFSTIFVSPLNYTHNSAIKFLKLFLSISLIILFIRDLLNDR